MTVLDHEIARGLMTALAQGPQAYIAQLAGLVCAVPNVTAMTLLALTPDGTILRRIGTSDATNLPVGGFDRVDDGAWCRRILQEKQPIIANDTAQMRVFLPETDDLLAMGFGASLNLPLIVAGQVRGTLNLLGPQDAFTDEVLAEIEALLPLVALIFSFDAISDLPLD